MKLTRTVLLLFVILELGIVFGNSQETKKTKSAPAIKRKPRVEEPLFKPPSLPEGLSILSQTSEKFLQAPNTLQADVEIARTPPLVEFLYYPGQSYEGKPWSNWGDGLCASGKYYSSIGDHLAIGSKGDGRHGTGTARVFEYDPQRKSLRQLVDVAELLNLSPEHYTPGKIHTRLDLDRDGWLYFATHRGSEKATLDQYHYAGDWIVRVNPTTSHAEVVVHAPVPNHSIPNGMLDPKRLIFYGGTAPGENSGQSQIYFFAYDVERKKNLYAGPDGPARSMILATSTGRVYFVPGNDVGPLFRFDPSNGQPPARVKDVQLGIRATTNETSNGLVYGVSSGQRSKDATLWALNTATEEVRTIGTAAVGTQAYIASIDVDPTGRFLYYVPGAHGGSEVDGSPVVQFDLRSGKKKVIAFLEPFFTDQFGFTLKGTYSTAINETGETLYITWNVSRGSRAWDCCGLMAVQIPASERE